MVAKISVAAKAKHDEKERQQSKRTTKHKLVTHTHRDPFTKGRTPTKTLTYAHTQNSDTAALSENVRFR